MATGPSKSQPEASRGEHRVFHGADLRGMSFEGAFLAGADFSGTRMGIRPIWQVVLVMAALVVSIGLGVVTGLGARFFRSLLESGDPRQISLALDASAGLLVLIVAALWKGGEVATRVVLPVVAAMVVAVGLIAIATGVGTGVGSVAILAFLFVGVAIIALGALVRAVAGETAGWTFALVAIAGGLAGGLVGGGIAAVVVAITAVVIGRRAMKGTRQYPLLSRLAVQTVCRRGTRFRNADLSDASFSDAHLVACDFRGAKLGGVDLSEAKRIRMCLFDGNQDTPPPSQLEARPRSPDGGGEPHPTTVH